MSGQRIVFHGQMHHDENAWINQLPPLYDATHLTFVGRYRDIISETLAVVYVPFACRVPSPFAPIGESIAMGVKDMAISS